MLFVVFVASFTVSLFLNFVLITCVNNSGREVVLVVAYIFKVFALVQYGLIVLFASVIVVVVVVGHAGYKEKVGSIGERSQRRHKTKWRH